MNFFHLSILRARLIRTSRRALGAIFMTRAELECRRAQARALHLLTILEGAKARPLDHETLNRAMTAAVLAKKTSLVVSFTKEFPMEFGKEC